jgi:hypothetical protein
MQPAITRARVAASHVVPAGNDGNVPHQPRGDISKRDLSGRAAAAVSVSQPRIAILEPPSDIGMSVTGRKHSPERICVPARPCLTKIPNRGVKPAPCRLMRSHLCRRLISGLLLGGRGFAASRLGVSRLDQCVLTPPPAFGIIGSQGNWCYCWWLKMDIPSLFERSSDDSDPLGYIPVLALRR